MPPVVPATPLYAAIMLVAIALGAIVGRRGQRSLGLTGQQQLGIALGAFCGGMIGAKLPFALADWPGLLTGRAWLDNGKTLVFGLVGGYLGVEWAKAALGVRVKTGDSFAVPVAVAVGVGRLACFSVGCCHGGPTALPWGVDFGDGIRRHPTQLYECGFHLTMAAILLILQRRGVWRGQLIKLYILAYLLYRFLSEWLRPEPVVALGLTGYQWAALALIPVFVGLWIHDARSPSPSPGPPADRQALDPGPA